MKSSVESWNRSEDAGKSFAGDQTGNARAKHAATVFRQHCIACNNMQPRDMSPSGPPNLFRVFRNNPSITPREAKAIIRGGKIQMPSFAGKLSGAEIDDVLAYLRTRRFPRLLAPPVVRDRSR
ncbi:MAG: cytochrome c [Terracidiphilus sp.]